jgi:hypothetical protein
MVLSLLLCVAGCGGGIPGLQRVTGKITVPGGGPPPKGEISVVRFEPVAGTQAEGQAKGASGDIQPDGTFTLTTVQKNDGAFVGEYKVCFTILKAYPNGPSLVDPKFASAGTTPHTAKVTKGGKNYFEFEVVAK